jgi:hypothetical protein
LNNHFNGFEEVLVNILKGIMKKYILLLLISVAIYSQDSKEITGVWQDMEILASGWSNTYMFYPGGSYKFFYSQMDCSKRTVSEEGTFEVKDSFISLNPVKIGIIEGGIMEPSNGSCGSDSMITGGVFKKIDVKNLEAARYPIGEVQTETNDEIERTTILIGNGKFWKFGSEPDEFIKQFEN